EELRIAVDEGEGLVAQRDDRVEPVILVLVREELGQRRLIVLLREARGVDEFGVVVEPASEAVVEQPRQLALADDRNLGVAPRRVDGEHLMLVIRHGLLRRERQQRGPQEHRAHQNSTSAAILKNSGVWMASG